MKRSIKSCTYAPAALKQLLPIFILLCSGLFVRAQQTNNSYRDTLSAQWKAANKEVAAAVSDPRIAAVLDAIKIMDAAVVNDDHAAFAARLAKDLLVNNPQNGISIRGATGTRNTAGLISYSSYVRSIEYAGLRGDMVLLMGDERVVPKGNTPLAGKEIRRRFTDLWKQEDGHWVLTARQATIVAPD